MEKEVRTMKKRSVLLLVCALLASFVAPHIAVAQEVQQADNVVVAEPLAA